MTAAPETPRSREDILDLPTLEELLSLDDGATGLLVEMTGLFREDGPQRILQMKEACTAADAHLVGESAHALKGAAGTLGSVELRALAGEAERLARQKDIPSIQALIPALDDSYARFLVALEGFITERS
jgi:HPt (histidine-containing phosphotransfer) domain-containing protein